MYRLINQGSHTVNSWWIKSFVGTEKTSMGDINERPHSTSGTSLTIQLLQGELLGFPDKAENHKPSDKVEASVEADYD